MGSARDALSAAVDALAAAGVEAPRLDAELMLVEALGATRESLYAEPEQPVTGAASRSFAAMVRRRVRREPLAYVLGRAHFRRLELTVDRRVLIPRPETELLVESIADQRKILDVGTGSGAVALAIADEHPGADVYATDTSNEALAVARLNAGRLGLDVTFEHADLVSGTGYDAIVSNPPYVSEPEWSGLQPEITEYEPRAALLAGADGLEVIRQLVRSALNALNPGGLLAIEVGHEQAAAVVRLARDAGSCDVGTTVDLAGIERVVWAKR